MQVTKNVESLQKRLSEIGTSREDLKSTLEAIKAVYIEIEVERSLAQFERLIAYVP